MALKIETFSNTAGGNVFYKAISHPRAADPAEALIAELAGAGPIAVYDPMGLADAFAELHPLDRVDVAEVYVQDIERIGEASLGRPVQPISEITQSSAAMLFVIAFDSGRLKDHIRHALPDGMPIRSLDAMRIPRACLTNTDRYLDRLNFATNFAFFRDDGGRHTRLMTAEYWSSYRDISPELDLMLFDHAGAQIAEWRMELTDPGQAILIDSADIRARFGLGDFTGQLFVHAVGIAGHDVVKYALDSYTDGYRDLSCTHDANSWPSDRYAGLPAPKDGERVIMWIQNSHPRDIPAGAVGLNRMGDDDIAPVADAVPAFGSCEIDVTDLLPDATWPQQIEVRAGKHFVRPRYEIVAGDKRMICHINVERADLKPDPKIAEIGNLMGKGFILPAPCLPNDRWRSVALPTPMAESQETLPVAAVLNDADGREIARKSLGCLPRDHDTAVDLSALAAEAGGFPSGYGHVELVYDFADGGEADGWLHGLFRYEDIESGHTADTSFGAHIFNTVLTYKNEPQSYAGPAPGLSTRLFLRLGIDGVDTLCQLIYPASTPWHEKSDTMLMLHDARGREVARETVEIPCGGSYLWRYSDVFDADTRSRAGDGAYVIIRDTTCRLFGYHGLLNGNGGFALDHMFGF